MNEKIPSLGQNVSEQYSLLFYEHTNVYCVYTRNVGANLWLLLVAKSMPFGCMSMDRLGACMRLLGACMRKRLGACMRLLGASLIAADSLPDSRWPA